MNISYTTLEEAWGEDFKKTKSKKNMKNNKEQSIKHIEQPHQQDKQIDHFFSVDIKDEHLISYFSRYTDDYRISYINDILHKHVKNASIHTKQFNDNNVILYLLLILIVILMFDKFM